VPLFFLLRWRGRPRPGVEFALLLVLVAATFVPAQARLYAIWLQTGVDVLQSFMGNTIVTLVTFAMPLLFMLGMDIADFVYRASSRETEAVASRLPGVALYALLALVLGWRLRDVVRETLAAFAGRDLATVLPGYVGALGFPLLAFFIWWLVTRLKAGERSIEVNSEEAAAGMRGYAALLIVAFNAIGMLTGVLSMLVLAVNAAGLQVPIDLNQIQRGANVLVQQEILWFRLVAAGALLAALWLARRGRSFAALYLGVVGVRFAWNELTTAGQLLGFLEWQGVEPVDFWWVVLFAGVALFWLLRRELTSSRAARLVLVVLMSGLLRQTSFIENPFSPFLGSLGVAFVAFAIVWDALSSGAWANVSTPGLPRVSRIFLYLGYVLFTVTLLNWFLTVHSLSYVETFTGGGALGGLNLVGRPLLFALFVVLLMQRDGIITAEKPLDAVAGPAAESTDR
ncbi:MAG TPA: hypothetical protein VER55_08175, partial [Ardenticatenaceae bacterium]|nr:hypothetical protein [Ardenticatenaceae bacterium]